MTSAMVQLKELAKTFPGGKQPALASLSAAIPRGVVTGLVGPDGAGKTTLMRLMAGLLLPSSGSVSIDPDAAEGSPGNAPTKPDGVFAPSDPQARDVVGYMPQKFGLYEDLSVRENLELGAVLRRGESLTEDFDRVHELFPRLLERRSQLAGTLSGGEQQMVAMGRALMSRPRLLLMDEPSMGLSPALVLQNFQIIKTIHASGVAVLMVEQNVLRALRCSHRGYVLENGTITLSGASATLLADERIKRAYLGR